MILRTLLQTFAGILLTLTGIALMYIFLTNLDKGANFLFLILSILFIGGGVFFFLLAGKSDSTVTSKMPAGMLTTDTNNNPNFSKTLAKNNELVKQWKESNTTKDKLKMVEMSAAAQAEAEINK